jgi:hypothetical protein
MVRVIAHPEPLTDDLHHPTTGPQRGRETEGLGSLEDPPCQGAPLSGAQLRRPARGRPRLQPLPSPASVAAVPPANRAPINAESLGDDVRLDALPQHLHRTKPTGLELLRGAVRSHKTSVTRQIRTLITQVSIAAMVSLQQPCPVVASVTPGWAVEYSEIDGVFLAGESMRFWIGLRNNSDHPRAVCLTAVWYSFQNADEHGSNSGGSAIGMSPHSCRDLSQFQLLMPSQTTYVLARVDAPDSPGKYSMHFSVSARTRDKRGEGALDVEAESAAAAVSIGAGE